MPDDDSLKIALAKRGSKDGHWVTTEDGHHLFLPGARPGKHGDGRPSAREQADAHRAKKGDATWRARAGMARTKKQFDKSRAAAKRAIKKGDADAAERHTARAQAHSRRLERLLPHALGTHQKKSIEADDMPGTHIEFGLGDEAKALGEGRFAGRLVNFGTPDRSKKRDWFDAKTDFGFQPGETITAPLYFHHGLDKRIGPRRFGRAELSIRDDGVYCSGSMKLDSPEAREIYAEIEAGSMKLSSGVPGYLIRRRPVGDTNYVSVWPLGGDCTVTPTPADTNTFIHSMKALVDDAAKSVMSEAGAGYAPANPMPNCPKCGKGMACEHCPADAAKSADDEANDDAVPASLLDRLRGVVPALDECKALTDAAVASRKLLGRDLSPAKRDAVDDLATSLKALSDAFAALAEPPAPVADATPAVPEIATDPTPDLIHRLQGLIALTGATL